MGNICDVVFGAQAVDDEGALILEPPQRRRGTLIFLHGLGDTGEGWRAGLGDLGQSMRLVLPTASCKAVSINGGARMPSWFDIKGLSPDAPQDEAGIEAAADLLRALVEREIASGVEPSRIFVGGFSQGGAVALHLAYTSGLAARVGGVVALSTWLPLAHISAPQVCAPPEHLPPALLCHGSADPMVPLAFGKTTAQLLRGRGVDLAFHEYPGLAHSSCPQELRQVATFIHSQLGEMSD